MAVTRDQASRLLSESEMSLFSDSRNPTLRSFSARELTRRIERARKLRDKSRDLLQRQRLGSRKRTGSKGGATGDANERTARKGEVFDDILQRFESRLQEVQRSDEAASGRAAAGARARKPATRQPAARKRAAQTQAAPRKATGKAAVEASSAAEKTPRTMTGRATTDRATAAPAGSARKSTAAKRPRKTAITPEQALAQTRELLQAKQQHDREPRAYQLLDEQAQPGHPEPGYQSGSAKSKAQELHAGEVRLEPIHGSISTRDRRSQGKRDHR